MAVLITLSLLWATQETGKDRQRHFVAAQQARLEALECVQKELADKESLRRELLRHIVQAQEDERARIARELHDETAQTLAAFSLDLATMQAMTPDKPECRQVSARLLALSKEMSQGLYRLVHDLRPAQLDDLGLIAALQYLVEQDAKANGLDVQFSVDGTIRRLDAITETVLFRVTQEALTNVIRHSGTKQAVVSLAYKTQEVVLTIKDSGIGFDPKQNFIPPHGWGLAGIMERVEAVGGHLNIDSSPGKGTVIRVSVHVFDLIP
jgi:signal transduction histidine kinase